MKAKFLCSAMILVLAACHAQSTYSNAVMSLSPAGYWPMHEVEAAVPGDIETNYGSIGQLGTGYYPDWAQGSGAFTRQAAGALGSDSDSALRFNRLISSGAGAAAIYTNQIYVPHTSPLTTLNPPFTVELWYYPTNTASQTFFGQFGFEALNAGNQGLGSGNYVGTILVYNGAFTVYGENGVQTALIASGTEPITNWYHLVVTCDANTNFNFYINGAQQGGQFAGVGKFSPDYWSPMTIGGSRGGTRSAPGSIDEVAIYTNVITDISQHYSDGTNAAPATSYFHDVTNDHPVIYLRMDAPAYTAPPAGTWPTLVNYGTTNGVAIGNGVYNPGAIPGLLPGATNFGGATYAGVMGNSVLLSGVGTFGDAGSAPAYNPVGSNANFTVTAMFRGFPCDGRVQSVVGHGTNSWQLSVTTNGCLVFNAGNGNKAAGGTGQAAGDITTTGVYNDGNWHQVVAINSTNVIAIYVDGVLDTNGTPNGITVTNIIPGNLSDIMIGSDPTYTNIPAGVGRSFAGQVCDVAFFTNALTPGQVQTLYNASGVAPYITEQPASGRIVAGGQGTSINFSVLAHGSSAAYQWYFNTSSNFNGATRLVDNVIHYTNSTTSQLTITNLTGSDSGYYFVVVTNNYGSVTSLLASLTVNTAVVITGYLPMTYTNPFILFAGVSPTFSVAVNGSVPISYQWYTNGVLDGAATGSNFTWVNVPLGTISNYCVAINSAGKATNLWTATVIGAPTNANGLAPYPQQVLALNPVGYWRLNDYMMEGDDFNGDNGFIAYDYAGGNNGIYTNVYLDNTGYSSTDPSDTSVQFDDFSGSFPSVDNNYAGAIEGIDFAATNGANAEFTVEAWVNGVLDQQPNPGAIVTQGKYGTTDSFNLGLDSTGVHNFQFYVRNAGGQQFTADSAIAPDGNWHHLAGVCDESNGLVSLYIDGHLAKTASIPVASGLYEAAAPITLGAGTADGINYIYQFLGNLNDVAVYKQALTSANVAMQYVSLGSTPTVSPAPPATADVNGGGVLVIPAVAVGTPISGYYWTDEHAGTNVAAGTTNGAFLNATLTFSNVPGSWNGDTLQLTVTNQYGANTYSVVLTVNTNAPIATLQLPTPVTVMQGNSYNYSVGADGVTPLFYQWYNGATAILNATNASYTVTAGAPGSTTYSVTVSNQFGGFRSSTSTFTSISSARPILTSGYGTNLMLLNPVGYWPMHEVESSAQGNIEVNYGSLGPLGTAFYPNWATNAGGIQSQVPGALVYDSDTAAFFNDNIGTGSTIYTTNELYIPLNSPLTTLNPPFTVECWCQPTNTGGGQDVWAQFGDEGFEAGNAGGTSGNFDGIQLVYNGSLTVYGEFNGVQTGLISSGSEATNRWCYVVVTCDASTNFQMYVNGASVGTASGAGKYTPDYWTPITVAGGRGGTRSFAGSVDEFVIYTNVLQPADVTAHYNAGLSAGPGQYFQDVMVSNPAIYLRMDAANYSVPSTNFWPVLLNYGSVAVNGLYTPGTMPGILLGPSTNPGGASFTGLAGNVPMLNGVSSFADAGYASAYNPVGAVPFSVSAMFRGNPCDDRFQNIVGHSDASWRIGMNNNGTLQCTLGTNSTSVLNTPTSATYNDKTWHQVVEVYTPASNPTLPGTNSLYVDGTLIVSTNNVTPNGVLPGVNADVMIGSDPQYTNNLAGIGRQFAGQVCEVALFTNALNAGEVSALYAAALNPNNVPAYVAPEPPLNATVAPGGTLSLVAGAAGASPVGYIWQINTNGGGSSVLSASSGSSALSANLTVGNVPATWNGGQLQLTVTNAYGTNIAFVTLAVVNPVNTNSPVIGFSVTNNQLALSWPSDHTGWQLQAQTNSLSVGINTNWANVSGSTLTNQVIIPINLTNGSVFYRLIYP